MYLKKFTKWKFINLVFFKESTYVEYSSTATWSFKKVLNIEGVLEGSDYQLPRIDQSTV